LERLRRFVRKLIGFHSPFYRAGAWLLDFAAVMKSDGWDTWKRLRTIQESREDSAVSVKLKNIKHPIFIRPNTADARTVLDTIVREEYGQLKFRSEPKWMIDAGAYIGDTSCYFLSRFAGLRVIALEPNFPSYEMAKMNLRPYGERVSIMNKGLADKDRKLSFGGSSTGVYLHGGDFEIDCTSIETILTEFSVPQIHILKMDIEGAEEMIFLESPERWLQKVDVLLIELHGERIEKFVGNVLKQNGFSLRKYRSIWYCERTGPLSATNASQ
jgi:FkbM family methyltransferase